MVGEGLGEQPCPSPSGLRQNAAAEDVSPSPEASMVARGPASPPRADASLLAVSSPVAGTRGSMGGLFHRGTNPIMRAPALCPK